jgi:hypothetical protein
VNSGWAGSLAEGAIRSRLTPTVISVLVARASNATSSKPAAVNHARTCGVRSGTRAVAGPDDSATTEIRILFVFDPWRSAILLVAGDKSGKWNRWSAEAIPHAEQLYDIYLKERAEEETGR